MRQTTKHKPLLFGSLCAVSVVLLLSTSLLVPTVAYADKGKDPPKKPSPPKATTNTISSTNNPSTSGSTTTLKTDHHTIKAIYSKTTNFAGSFDSLKQTVNPDPPKNIVSLNTNSPNNGNSNHESKAGDHEAKEKGRKDKDNDKDKPHDNCDSEKYDKTCLNKDKDCDSEKYDKVCTDKDIDKNKVEDTGKEQGKTKDKDFDIPTNSDYEIPSK